MAGTGAQDEVRKVIEETLEAQNAGDAGRLRSVRFTRAGGGGRPVRMTGVLVRDDGQWKVVQSHASIGVPNAGTFG
jgi:hypothetical protein